MWAVTENGRKRKSNESQRFKADGNDNGVGGLLHTLETKLHLPAVEEIIEIVSILRGVQTQCSQSVLPAKTGQRLPYPG